eukprot:1160062-Pelagomonas_calceolata.AAC.8
MAIMMPHRSIGSKAGSSYMLHARECQPQHAHARFIEWIRQCTKVRAPGDSGPIERIPLQQEPPGTTHSHLRGPTVQMEGCEFT